MARRSQLLQDRSLTSRAALVAAADQLWAERAVDEVKVAEICELAEVAKGSFYFYFRSRESVAADLFAADADAVADAVAETTTAHHRFDDLLRVAVTTLGRRAQRRPRHVLAVGVPEWIRTELAADDGDGLHVPLADTFATIVDSGRVRRRGTPTVPDDVDSAIAGRLFADSCALAVHAWAVSPRRQPSLARRMSERVDLLVRGVAR